MAYKRQVTKKHYDFESYLPQERWVSYYHQIKSVMKVKRLLGKNSIKILVIGVGDNIVPRILREMGHEIKTLDLDKSLKPDYNQALPDISIKEKFDCILCSQVLEHITFDDARKSIKYFANMCKYLVISLPDKRLSFSVTIKPWFFNTFRTVFSVLNPLRFKSKYNGQHYWELGDHVHTPGMFRRTLYMYGFIILESYRVVEIPYHHFFISKKQ